MIDFILAYRAVKEQRARQKAVKRFIGKDPDYTAIQYLIDQARTDIVAKVTFPNGTTLELKKRDHFDALQDFITPEKAGSY